MLAFDVEADRVEVFGVPVFRRWYADCEALNRELRRVILDARKASEGRVLPRIGGWHSQKDLHLSKDSSVEELLRRVASLVREVVQSQVPEPGSEHLQHWSIEAWANLTERGEGNGSHIHSIKRGALWSGFYYVDVGADPERAGGQTTFEDDSGVPVEGEGDSAASPREYSVEPRDGLMVLFPSALRHRVDRVLAQSPRLSIAWNLYHPRFAVPRRAMPRSSGRKAWMWRNFRGLMLPLAQAKKHFRPKPPEPVQIAPFPLD